MDVVVVDEDEGIYYLSTVCRGAVYYVGLPRAIRSYTVLGVKKWIHLELHL